jgi:hypothetical protein
MGSSGDSLIVPTFFFAGILHTILCNFVTIVMKFGCGQCRK